MYSQKLQHVHEALQNIEQSIPDSLTFEPLVVAVPGQQKLTVSHSRYLEEQNIFLWVMMSWVMELKPYHPE